MDSHGIRKLSLLGTTVMLFATTAVEAAEVIHLRGGDVRIEDRSADIATFSARKRTSRSSSYVVQFNRSVRDSDREALSRVGVEALRYLPDDAFLVRGRAEAVALAARSIDGVRAVAEYQPSWRYTAEIFDSRSPLVVTLTASDEATAVAKSLAAKAGIEVLHVGQHEILVQAQLDRVAAVAAVDGVEWVDRLPLFTTMDFVDEPSTAETSSFDGTVPPYTGFESGTKVMNFEAAYSLGFTGRDQTVAIADTGVDTGKLQTLHPDLATAVKGGFPVGFGSRSWEDPNGHGTHVAGSIIGNGAKSEGRIRGGTDGAKFYAVGLWSPIMNNLSFKPEMNEVAGAAYRQGARIHSNSWGSPQNLGTYDAFARSADEFMWNNPDMLVLFAAGNSGEDANRDGHIDQGSVSSPGTAKNVLTVGASENMISEGGIQKAHKELRGGTEKYGTEPIASDRLSDNPNGIAAFSSRGPTRDGRLKPEIVAPGTNIVSTRSKHPSAGALWGAYGEDYAYAGGTSMATPLTAGAATVVREYLVKGKGVANPSAALLKATLIHTATDLFPGQYGTGAGQEFATPRPNIHEGYGRVDVGSATHLNTAQVIDDEGVAAQAQKTVAEIEVVQGGSLRATLVYTDAPGAVSASKALVNDLDLVVVSPSGSVVEKADRVNNTEMLELNQLSAGKYQVIVKGTRVAVGRAGRQPFAVVAQSF